MKSYKAYDDFTLVSIEFDSDNWDLAVKYSKKHIPTEYDFTLLEMDEYGNEIRRSTIFK